MAAILLCGAVTPPAPLHTLPAHALHADRPPTVPPRLPLIRTIHDSGRRCETRSRLVAATRPVVTALQATAEPSPQELLAAAAAVWEQVAREDHRTLSPPQLCAARENRP